MKPQNKNGFLSKAIVLDLVRLNSFKATTVASLQEDRKGSEGGHKQKEN